MSDRISIPYGDSSYTLRIDLPSEFGTITTAQVEIRDTGGSNLRTGSITKFEDVGGTSVKATSAAHGLAVGDIVTITGTTSYNDTFTITAKTADTFTWVDTFVADDATGTWTATLIADPLAIGTLASAAERLSATLTLTTPATNDPSEFDLLVVEESATGGREFVTVDGYNSSTGAVTLKDNVSKNHATGATVYGRWIEVDLDFSDTDVYTVGKELVFLIDGLDTDDTAFERRARIDKKKAAIPGLENTFRVHCHRFWPIVKDNWTTWYDAAFAEISDAYELNDGDLDHVVDGQSFSSLMQAWISHDVAVYGGDEFEHEVDKMKAHRDELFKRFGETNVWQDTNQDGSESDSETQVRDRKPPRRRI